VAEPLPWHAQARCAGDSGFLDLAAPEQAPTCSRCPVRKDCIEDAVANAGCNASATLGVAALTREQIFQEARRRRAAERAEKAESRDLAMAS